MPKRRQPKQPKRAPPAKRPRQGPSRAQSAMQLIKPLARLGLGAASTMYPGLAPFATLIGGGDYSVKENSLVPGIVGSPNGLSVQVPNMHSSNNSVRVRHKEFLQDISTPGSAFTLQSFDINPGDAATFPWLAILAQGFQEYRFKGLAFEFKSTSANALNSTNTALGTVIMAVEYNPDANLPGSKLIMESQMGSVSCKPSSDAICLVECAENQTTASGQFYIRNPGVTPSSPLLYDLGTFYIATTGQQATSAIGELWVTYDVELYKPTAAFNSLVESSYAHYSSVTAVAATPINTGASNQPVKYIDTLPGGLIFQGVGTAVRFNPQLYPLNSLFMYTIIYRGTAAVITAPIPAAGANTSLPNILDGLSRSYVSTPVNGVSSTTLTITGYVLYSTAFTGTLSGTNMPILFSLGTAGTIPTALASSDIIVTCLGGNTT